MSASIVAVERSSRDSIYNRTAQVSAVPSDANGPPPQLRAGDGQERKLPGRLPSADFAAPDPGELTTRGAVTPGVSDGTACLEAALITAGERLRGNSRTAALGLAAGVGYGLTAALMKSALANLAKAPAVRHLLAAARHRDRRSGRAVPCSRTACRPGTWPRRSHRSRSATRSPASPTACSCTGRRSAPAAGWQPRSPPSCWPRPDVSNCLTSSPSCTRHLRHFHHPAPRQATGNATSQHRFTIRRPHGRLHEASLHGMP